MNAKNRISLIILEAARDQLASRLEHIQLQILREERWPHIKYFHAQEVKENNPLPEYLAQLGEAHALVLRMKHEVQQAEAEEFGKEIVLRTYFRSRKARKA